VAGVVAIGIAGAIALAIRGVRPADDAELSLTATDAGLSLDDVERDLCAPLEATFASVGLASWSEVREGVCVVHAPLHGRDVTEASAAVNDASHGPASAVARSLVEAPILARGGASHTVWITLASEASLVDSATWLEHDLARRIESVDGVRAVEVCGPSAASELVIDPVRLAAYGLTLVDVSNVGSAEVPAGSLVVGDRDAPLRVGGRSDSILDAVIADRGGASIRLSDVARLESTTVERACVIASGGMPIVGLRVSIATSEAEAALAAIRARVDEAEGHRPTLLDAPTTIALTTASPMAAERLSGELSRSVGRPVIVVAHPESLALDVIDADADPSFREQLARPGVALRARSTDLGRLWVAGGTADERSAAAERVRARLDALDVLATPGAGPAQPEVSISIDQAQATRLGASTEDIARTVALARGASVGTIDGEDLRMRVAGMDDPFGLRNLLLRGTDGAVFPLSTVVVLREELVSRLRHRENGEPALLFWVSADRRVSRDEITSAFAPLEIPAGLRITFEPID
jgi:multidrug efflux pump subunit AcrB